MVSKSEQRAEYYENVRIISRKEDIKIAQFLNFYEK